MSIKKVKELKTIVEFNIHELKTAISAAEYDWDNSHTVGQDELLLIEDIKRNLTGKRNPGNCTTTFLDSLIVTRTNNLMESVEKLLAEI